MFQGMFRKRGRPPEPPLQIGGFDKPSHEEIDQIPAHQLRDAPRQLPLPAVREYEPSAIVQQEQTGLTTRLLSQACYNHNMMLICQIHKIDAYQSTLDRL